MKITNRTGLPQAFVEMASSEYQYKPQQYSATSLLRGLRETILLRRYHDEIEVDAADMIWMLWGQAVHYILEQQKEREHEFKEEYLKEMVPHSEGYHLSGKFDLYSYKDKKITDYKTSSVWKIIYKDFADWKKQLLIYAWLVQKAGFPVQQGEVVAILKDHSKAKAKREKKYPKLPVERINFTFTTQELADIEKFIVVRFQEIAKLEELADNELPTCTPEERWNTGDKWAVMKRGRKTAVRVLDSEEEAQEYIEQRITKDLDKHHIELRPGEDKKCQDYCFVSQYCNHYQEVYGDGRKAELSQKAI